MIIYRRGLKEYIKDELLRIGAALKILDELMTEAINIDDKWYDRAMEKKRDGGLSEYQGINRLGYAQ